MRPYEGITYPRIFDCRLVRWFWEKYMCPQNKHLLDEVWSPMEWYMCCDACGIEVHIREINKEWCDEQTNFFQNCSRRSSGGHNRCCCSTRAPSGGSYRDDAAAQVTMGTYVQRAMGWVCYDTRTS